MNRVPPIIRTRIGSQITSEPFGRKNYGRTSSQQPIAKGEHPTLAQPIGFLLLAIGYWLFERASGEFANPLLLGAGSHRKLNDHAGEMDRGGRLEPGGI
jgi:hypothetical protein